MGSMGEKKEKAFNAKFGENLNKSSSWSIVDNVFGECYAPCTLKTSFIDFEIEQTCAAEG